MLLSKLHLFYCWVLYIMIDGESTMNGFIKRWEKAITSLSSAIVFSFWACLVFVLSTSDTSLPKIYQLAVGWVFLGILPFLLVYYLYRKGIVGINVSSREMRPVFYGFSIFSYGLSAFIFRYFGVHDLFFLSMCYVVVTSTVLVFNFWTKISAHTSGSSGPITAISLVFGYEWMVLYLIPLYLVYLRHKQGAHNYLQLVLGIVIAVTMTFFTYLTFY